MTMISDSIEISAPLDKVFDTISHLEIMGQFSPENTGGSWVKGSSGPALGARFRGTNSNGKKNWSTAVRVSTYEPSSSFAFLVSVGPAKVAQWSYHLESCPDGTKVTESWTDQRSSLSKRMSKGIVSDREAFTLTSIRTTLEKLKAHLEA